MGSTGIFVLPLEKIFGRGATDSFAGLEEILGFWNAWEFRRLRKMLKRMNIAGTWPQFIKIDYSDAIYEGQQDIESLPEEPPVDGTVFVIFTEDGAISRFEVLMNGRLRRYLDWDWWSLDRYPKSDSVPASQVRVGDSWSLQSAIDDSSSNGLSKIVRIIMLKPKPLK